MPTIADTRCRNCPAHTRLVLLSTLAVSFLALSAASSAVGAQGPTSAAPAVVPQADSARKVLGPDDYGRWRTVGDQAISSDGKWVTWVYRFTNVAEREAKPELHVLNLETNEDVAIHNASNGTFSPDARWIVYQVDSMPPRNGRGGRGAQSGDASQAQGGRGGGAGTT